MPIPQTNPAVLSDDAEAFFVEPQPRSCKALREVMKLNGIHYRLVRGFATPATFLDMMKGQLGKRVEICCRDLACIYAWMHGCIDGWMHACVYE